MAIAKIRVGDTVKIIAGADKGQVGEVLAIDSQRRKIKVSGVRMVKKHVKPNPQIDRKGGIESQESFLDISNAVGYDVSTQKPMAIGIKEVEGKRVRYDKKTGQVIDKKETK